MSRRSSNRYTRRKRFLITSRNRLFSDRRINRHNNYRKSSYTPSFHQPAFKVFPNGQEKRIFRSNLNRRVPTRSNREFINRLHAYNRVSLFTVLKSKVCGSRRSRREVLFSLRRIGRGMSFHKNPIHKITSSINCRRK